MAAMDVWRYYGITHADHVVCNPTSPERLDEVIALLDLPASATIWEAASGKGELLIRLVERFGSSGTGVDASPFEVAVARERARARVPAAAIDFIEGDAATSMPGPGTADLAICLGASWIWGGHAGTLRALTEIARPGGLVLVGEPYWRQDPAPEYLAAGRVRADEFGTNAANVETGQWVGLAPVYAMPSAVEDFDRYEALQWRAADRWAVAHPDDPDRGEVLARVARDRAAYLRWGRDTLGWALYLFRKP